MTSGRAVAVIQRLWGKCAPSTSQMEKKRREWDGGREDAGGEVGVGASEAWEPGGTSTEKCSEAGMGRGEMWEREWKWQWVGWMTMTMS
ncbi:Nuclear protein localization protein 4 [Venturia inaequalis]|nr:Nuclear protein localization protein 4 [Venturia inaequalis]